MFDFFNKHKSVIYITITVVFMISVFYGLGSYFTDGSGSGKAVAMVGKEEIPMKTFSDDYNRAVENFRDKGMDQIPDALSKQIKARIMQDLVVGELMAQCAEDYGFRVSDAELSITIRSQRMFLSQDGKFDPRRYSEFLYSVIKMRPQDYEKSMRRQILANKFRSMVGSAIRLAPGEVEAEYAARNKGSMKDFAKDKDKFTNELMEERGVYLLNQYLRQAQERHKIKVLLKDQDMQEAG